MSTGSNLDQSLEPDQGSGEPASNFGPDANRQTLQSLENAAGELARAMGLPGPRGKAQREALVLAARRALNAPDLSGVNLKTPESDSHTTDAMKNRFDSVVSGLLLDGRLEDDGGLLVMDEASDG